MGVDPNSSAAKKLEEYLNNPSKQLNINDMKVIDNNTISFLDFYFIDKTKKYKI